MQIEVISTGTELLKGSNVNTNLATIGRAFGTIGKTVHRAQTVGDDREALIAAFHLAALTGDVILVTGGLGPTADDLTRDVAAEFFGMPLIRSRELADNLRRYYRRRHGTGPIPATLFRQADVPQGAVVLPNANGSAPGLYLNTTYAGHACHVFLLPGPPVEMEPILDAEVLPRLAALGDDSDRTLTRGFLVAGGAELMIEETLAPRFRDCAVALAYCASAEGTRVFLSAADAALLDEKFTEAHQLFSGSALPEGCLSLAEGLVRLLKEQHRTLSLAESCTGGLTAAAITAVPGASEVFLGSVTAYDNRVKATVLGVPEMLLATSGAVSADCAMAMTRGVRQLLHTDCSAAITGIAGPGGGTPEKPVGLVYVAAACGDREAVRECRFRGNRESIRLRSRAAALQLLYQLVTGAPTKG